MFQPLALLHRQFTFSVLNRLLGPEQARSRAGYAPIRGRLLYVAQSARPYDINGYTARTHELLRALQEDGDVHVCTRCGYPWDRHRKASPAREDGFFSTLVDTVRYLHLPAPRNNSLTAIYAGRAARFLEALCRKIRPAIIHAASNHVNALPALIVAKRLGIPFQYEIRGLWELSRLANNPDYKRSHNLALGLELEGYVGADGTLQTIDNLLSAATAYLENQDAQQTGENLESIAQSVNIEDTSQAFQGLYNVLLGIVGPQLSQTYYAEGTTAYNDEDYGAAIESFTRAVYYDAANAEALYSLADAYRLNGDTENAVATYDRVIELFPDTDRARRAQRYRDDLSTAGGSQ